MDREDVIREQMEDTRNALTQKLETLEEKVTDATENVADAVENVTATVENVTEKVQETVEAVTETVQETVSTVKDTVKESVGAVQRIFDFSSHFDRHPWLMFLSSMAAGAIVDQFLPRPIRPTSSEANGVDAISGRSISAAGNDLDDLEERVLGNGAKVPFAPVRSEETGDRHGMAKESSKLKSLAVGALMSTLREVAVRSVPDFLAPQLAEVIDQVTEELGGKPIHAGPSSTRAAA